MLGRSSAGRREPRIAPEDLVEDDVLGDVDAVDVTGRPVPPPVEPFALDRRDRLYMAGYAAVGLLPAALIPAEGVLFRLIVWAAAAGGLALAHLVVALLSRLAVEKRERMQLAIDLRALSDRVARIESGGQSGDLVDELRSLQRLLPELARNRREPATGPARATATARASAQAGPADTRPVPQLPPLDPEAVLDAAVGAGAIDVMVTSIVRLPSRRPALIEARAVVHGPDGRVIGLDVVEDRARVPGLAQRLDNHLLLRALRVGRRPRAGEPNLPVVAYVTGHGLADPLVHEDLADYLAEDAGVPSSVIVAAPATTWMALSDPQINALQRLTRLGCRFLADGVDPKRMSTETLARGRLLAYVKIPAAVALAGARTPDGAAAFRDLLRELRARSIRVVVDHIDDEQRLIDLLDLGIEYGAGYLFGEPRRLG
ncbi:EAL domain-containing protein [Tistrella mobilis]